MVAIWVKFNYKVLLAYQISALNDYLLNSYGTRAFPQPELNRYIKYPCCCYFHHLLYKYNNNFIPKNLLSIIRKDVNQDRQLLRLILCREICHS